MLKTVPVSSVRTSQHRRSTVGCVFAALTTICACTRMQQRALTSVNPSRVEWFSASPLFVFFSTIFCFSQNSILRNKQKFCFHCRQTTFQIHVYSFFILWKADSLQILSYTKNESKTFIIRQKLKKKKQSWYNIKIDLLCIFDNWFILFSRRSTAP